MGPEGATPRKFAHGAKIIKIPAGKRTSVLDSWWPRAAIDDKAEFQESELAALKPTLLVADWNALEVEICIRKRVKSSAAGNDLG